MRGLFLFMALGLGAAGLGLIGLGLVMAAHGDLGPAGVGVAVGFLTLFGAYLFGRAALRTHRDLISHPLTREQHRDRRRRVWGAIAWTVAFVTSALFTPIPIAIRVIGAVIGLLALPIYLGLEFEPRKSRR
jgi:hypothetical protein